MTRLPLFLFVGTSLLLGFLLRQAPADTIDAFERKLKLEQNILQQVSNDLVLLVPDYLYKVSVVANIKTTKNLQQEHIVVSKPPALPKNPIALPGFSSEEKTAQRPGQERAETYVSVDELTKLTFYLMINTKMTAGDEKTITDYFNERWVSIDPETISVVTKRIAFSPATFMQGSSLFSWLNIRNSLIAGGFLLGMAMLLMFTRRRLYPEPFTNPSLALRESPPQASPEEQAASHSADREIFVGKLMEHPLFSRSFLRSLDAESQSKLCQAFQSEELRTLIARWLDRDYEEIESPAALDFTTLTSELTSFVEMRKKQISAPFGFLIDLLPEEIVTLVAEENQATMAVVLPALSTPQLHALLQAFDAQKQKEIAALLELATPSGDGNRINELERRLREQARAIADQVVLPHKKPDELLKALLDESPYAAELASRLVEKHPEWTNQLQKYRLTFDGVLQEKPEALRRIIGHLENDIVQHLLAGVEKLQREKLLGVISKERQRILKQLALSNGSQSHAKDVIIAKSAFMQAARDFLYKSA